MFKSRTQQIVTLSSTESEMVALVEGIQWMNTLQTILLEIGANPAVPIVFQDNKSVIHLIKNGEGAHGRNRHMRIKWNFIKEMIDNNDITIQYCSTHDMLADVLTKPITGKKFQELRDILLNNEK